MKSPFSEYSQGVSIKKLEKAKVTAWRTESCAPSKNNLKPIRAETTQKSKLIFTTTNGFIGGKKPQKPNRKGILMKDSYFSGVRLCLDYSAMLGTKGLESEPNAIQSALSRKRGKISFRGNKAQINKGLMRRKKLHNTTENEITVNQQQYNMIQYNINNQLLTGTTRMKHKSTLSVLQRLQISRLQHKCIHVDKKLKKSNFLFYIKFLAICHIIPHTKLSLQHGNNNISNNI